MNFHFWTVPLDFSFDKVKMWDIMAQSNYDDNFFFFDTRDAFNHPQSMRFHCDLNVGVLGHCPFVADF